SAAGWGICVRTCTVGPTGECERASEDKLGSGAEVAWLHPRSRKRETCAKSVACGFADAIVSLHPFPALTDPASRPTIHPRAPDWSRHYRRRCDCTGESSSRPGAGAAGEARGGLRQQSTHTGKCQTDDRGERRIPQLYRRDRASRSRCRHHRDSEFSSSAHRKRSRRREETRYVRETAGAELSRCI